ncbi:MAG: His/Gly/Thr/Pro-type tRNA ligase C-terminal domain-containing protein [Thermoleophilaceae bacterium]
MIHRALFGSFERFIGILTEHYAGGVPAVARARARHRAAGRRPPRRARGRCARMLLEAGVARIEVDERSESVGRKIRDAELRKIPYMLLIGDEEERTGEVAVRRHGQGDLGAMSIGELARRAVAEIGARTALWKPMRRYSASGMRSPTPARRRA